MDLLLCKVGELSRNLFGNKSPSKGLSFGVTPQEGLTRATGVSTDAENAANTLPPHAARITQNSALKKNKISAGGGITPLSVGIEDRRRVYFASSPHSSLPPTPRSPFPPASDAPATQRTPFYNTPETPLYHTFAQESSGALAPKDLAYERSGQEYATPKDWREPAALSLSRERSLHARRQEYGEREGSSGARDLQRELPRVETVTVTRPLETQPFERERWVQAGRQQTRVGNARSWDAGVADEEQGEGSERGDMSGAYSGEEMSPPPPPTPLSVGREVGRE